MQSYGSTVKKKSSSFRRSSLQALKPKLTSRPPQSQGFKLQAKVRKRKDPRTRVQAHKPTVQGASNKDKGIFRMFHVEGYLVR